MHTSTGNSILVSKSISQWIPLSSHGILPCLYHQQWQISIFRAFLSTNDYKIQEDQAPQVLREQLVAPYKWQRWIKAESPDTLWLFQFPSRFILLWPNQTQYLTALFPPCVLKTSTIWEAPPINLNVQISTALLTLKWQKSNNFKIHELKYTISIKGLLFLALSEISKFLLYRLWKIIKHQNWNVFHLKEPKVLIWKETYYRRKRSTHRNIV